MELSEDEGHHEKMDALSGLLAAVHHWPYALLSKKRNGLKMGFLYKTYLIMFLACCTSTAFAQENAPKNLRFSGQLSTWGQFSPDITTNFWLGGRYLPQLNYQIPLEDNRLIDFEASANVFGDAGVYPFDRFSAEGAVRPYRTWARYTSTRMEFRVGLQKINFGAAQMLRPLMWFDRVDPRDPLQLTDGVWGGLFRYYFQNNANVWLWSLYGNSNAKGWEFMGSSNRMPELGGRVQLPIPKGEGALSYHLRKADPGILMPLRDAVTENRIGFDIRLDMTVGLWLETSWTHLSQPVGDYTNQQMLTLGTDYTFDIGNGLGLTFEQLFFTYGPGGVSMDNMLSFSAINLSYPVNLVDNVGAIVYYDWTNNNSYNFLRWQRQLNDFTFFLISYWNPKQNFMPSQMAVERFIGKGVQVMVVWNH